MKNLNIPHLRLTNQNISSVRFEKPAEVVAWMGAVQAQDYLGALWAVGLRLRNAVEADIEQALADKTIVRTWPMRGTLHFVAAADVRWILKLLTPRVIARSAGLYRQAGLDDAAFSQSRKILIRALQGGRQLSRDAIYKVLNSAGIATSNQRGLHITGRLAQEGLICFGAREGKQQTFALLDEWVPAAATLERDEALAELARRYFTSHGPATLQDFVWWSGLTVADAKAGIEMAKSQLLQEMIEGQTYWLDSSTTISGKASAAYLLPAYDEYTVAYKDRGAVLDSLSGKQNISMSIILNPTMVVDGQVVGTWKRVYKKDRVVITPNPFAKLKPAQTRAFVAATKQYGVFLDAAVDWS